MDLATFKQVHNISSLNFYKSHTSNRRVASFGNNQLIVTTVDFNPRLPAYVYDNPKDENGYTLSNKKQAEAEFAL